MTTRAEQKERTRRAILDAALQLCEESTLAAVSLRQVAKEVGVVPTAFYRHFDSLEALGLELVEESFASLRATMREIRRDDQALPDVADRSVGVLAEHVRDGSTHVRFIARERAAGPPAVRASIERQLELVERDLAADLARLSPTASWTAQDRRTLAALVVTAMLAIAEDLLAANDRPGTESDAVQRGRTQLRMVLVGALQWRSTPEVAT